MIFADSELLQIVTVIVGGITTIFVAFLTYRTETLRRGQAKIIATQDGQTEQILATSAHTARLGADTARVVANLSDASRADVVAATTADRAAVVAEESLNAHVQARDKTAKPA